MTELSNVPDAVYRIALRGSWGTLVHDHLDDVVVKDVSMFRAENDG